MSRSERRRSPSTPRDLLRGPAALSRRAFLKGALWTATVLIIAALTFDYTAPFLLS